MADVIQKLQLDWRAATSASFHEFEEELVSSSQLSSGGLRKSLTKDSLGELKTNLSETTTVWGSPCSSCSPSSTEDFPWSEPTSAIWKEEARLLLSTLREAQGYFERYHSGRAQSCSRKRVTIVASRPVRLSSRERKTQHSEEKNFEDLLLALKQQVQRLLNDLLQGLAACEQHLEHLRADLVSLEAYECPSSSPGRTTRELMRVDAVRSTCSDLKDRTRGWTCCAAHVSSQPESLQALTSFLEESFGTYEQLQHLCGVFDARRVEAVARAKAAIEAEAAGERSSAAGLLKEAMSPTGRVDFPCVTEICQRVADCPEEARGSADLIFSALAESENEEDESREIPRRKLKALTIAHELLYDAHVLAEFAARPLEPLRNLECLPQGSGLGEPAEETIRMLAHEVRCRVEAARQKEEEESRSKSRFATWTLPTLLSSFTSPPVMPAPALKRPSTAWSGSVSTTAVDEDHVWEGDSKGPHRGRAGVEFMAHRLRRWGSWHRLGSGNELALLDDTRRTFEQLSNTLKRLHEELDCLDDGSTGLQLGKELAIIPPLLYASVDIRDRSESWTDSITAALNEGKPSSEAPPDLWKLAAFFEEALDVASELHRQCRHYAELRDDAVDRAKFAIEAARAIAVGGG